MSDGRYIGVSRVTRLAIVITTNTTLTSDSSKFIWADTTSGNVTVTLPAASSAIGKEFIIKKISSDGNQLIFLGTVEGVTPAATSTQYAYIRIYSDGSNWYNV